ncbi:MAG TPA: glutamate mutase L [Candidatus Cloacimonadota bacterium]|nr:glutamate mutase L [Candidatus Cloacimonadota bacterium]
MLKNRILITDIGSTTTKSLLFSRQDSQYNLLGLANFPTTVEKPEEDVKIGIYRSIRALEEKTKSSLLLSKAEMEEIKLEDDISFLATSSAGGGLQILVIGLTLFDSASSAERASYGAGGVLLDTLAIDDQRSPLEQMQLMEFLHPDIILFSGGIDGGAITGLIRLAEILAISDPKPKYGNKHRIPLIFAGNIEARDFIQSVLGKKFEIDILPNVRPTMVKEETEPVTEKIQEIFLNNVMEQAPGYAQVKTVTSSPIIPTPVGVLNDMKLLQEKTGKNILSVDIGGATTDVFSSILGCCYRTVSANYGMSYSISNVMKNCGIKNISRWLPESLSDDMIRNYVYNKMLYPSYLPLNDDELAIEQVLAIEAIRLSREQHMKMHFNIENIGFLDRLKNRDIDPFTEQMYAEKSTEHRTFHLGEIDIMIGAGGVISHAPTKEQAMAMMVFGLQPEGITELWRDKDFISPHLGILSKLDSELAYNLLMRDCYEKLAVHIHPYIKSGTKNKTLFTIECKDKLHPFVRVVSTGMMDIIPNDTDKEFEITLQDGVYLSGTQKQIKFHTSLPLLIDARDKKSEDSWNYLQILGKFEMTKQELIAFKMDTGHKKLDSATPSLHRLETSLPYPGEIMVHTGQKIVPTTKLGENLYGPPRIYVIQLSAILGDAFTPEFFRNGLKVKENDIVEVGQTIFRASTDGFFSGHSFFHDSNVRAQVTAINEDAETIIMREIQDYSSKPYTVDICGHLGILPKYLKAYVVKHVGDFVNSGEVLAKDMKKGTFVKATHTGTITNIDWKAGSLTIQYLHDPHVLMSHINGIVKEIRDEREFILEYEGIVIPGIIGFGKDDSGILQWSETPAISNDFTDKILVYPHSPTLDVLERFAKVGIGGLIIPSIDGNVISAYIDEEIGVALTGNEKIPFPVIIMNGFGDLSFDREVQDLLKKNIGKNAYLRPKTQIRAGVIRPQTIIS